ncbi:hypothetical protein [Actinomadura rupiterrae]|uniref:hypothetical protein n=1 Tax=Actinomadura rupiterrae TaxID=559627 RepID=UPI0020A479A5|nr:hypothetical protein [Actinomadura rupiterrae]MCP2338242.1 hypothetical protein [Actinomadura rupiterrae]
MEARTYGLGRIRAIVYVRERDVGRCRRWAACHDWTVVAVVREISPDGPVLARLGLRTVFGLLDAGCATVLLAASRREVSDEPDAFLDVCARVERAGGFVHVLDESEEDGDAP